MALNEANEKLKEATEKIRDAQMIMRTFGEQSAGWTTVDIMLENICTMLLNVGQRLHR